jgi:ATP-dependent Clp protease protease subunit
MDLTWGNNKRKFSEIDNDKDYQVSKKPKLFTTDNKMIYSIDNEVHFTADIDNENIENIIRKITKIVHKNKKKYEGSDDTLKITYIVDSPGGSVTAILKFVDFINMVKQKYKWVKFVSIATGLVASAGTIMCVVADTRLMTKHAHAMIHELSSGSSGKFTQLVSYGKFLNSLHTTLLGIYLRHTENSKENLERLLNSETWFNAEEYCQHGFVDKVVADANNPQPMNESDDETDD